MSVPKVPWHCEHNVNKKECEICGRPDSSSDTGRRGGSADGGRSPAGPGNDRDADSGPGGAPERRPDIGRVSDLIGRWYDADDVLVRGAAD